MKTSSYLLRKIIPALAALLLASCSLDETLYDVSTISDITTLEDINALVEGCYSNLSNANAFKSYGYYMLTVTADDISTQEDLAAPFGQKTFTGAHTDNFWNALYYTIRHANTVLATAEKLTSLPAADLEPLKGEAHFLRAFSYYYLVQLFGGVPLRLDQVTYKSNLYLPRSSVEEVYRQIFTDLDAANRYCLPTALKSGRATKGAAQAIMASAKLAFASWLSINNKTWTDPLTNDIQKTAGDVFQEAVNWCDSVINSNQYALFDDYAFLWNLANEPQLGQEVIFSIQFVTDNLATLAAAKGSEYALRYMPNSYVGGAVPGETGSDNFKITPAFFNEYYTDRAYTHPGAERTLADTLDYRIETSFMYSWINTNNGRYIYCCPFPWLGPEGVTFGTLKAAPYLKKYMDPAGKDKRNQGCDLNIIRYSEIYLIKAEALNELGHLPEAIQALNIIRTRARKAGATGQARPVPELLTQDQAADQGNMRSIILKERGLELIGEGHRWLDLVRMKSPSGDETMFDYRFQQYANEALYPRTAPATTDNGITWSNTNYVYWDRISRICDYRQTPNRYRLFPIPTTEIENNHRITHNNPGW